VQHSTPSFTRNVFILTNSAARTDIMKVGRKKEKSMRQLDRITRNPNVMGGKACVRGMRVTVAMIVGQVGAGRSVDEILAGYPYLEREDIMQALRFAALLAKEREVVLATA